MFGRQCSSTISHHFSFDKPVLLKRTSLRNLLSCAGSTLEQVLCTTFNGGQAVHVVVVVRALPEEALGGVAQEVTSRELEVVFWDQELKPGAASWVEGLHAQGVWAPAHTPQILGGAWLVEVSEGPLEWPLSAFAMVLSRVQVVQHEWVLWSSWWRQDIQVDRFTSTGKSV